MDATNDWQQLGNIVSTDAFSCVPSPPAMGRRFGPSSLTVWRTPTSPNLICTQSKANTICHVCVGFLRKRFQSRVFFPMPTLSIASRKILDLFLFFFFFTRSKNRIARLIASRKRVFFSRWSKTNRPFCFRRVFLCAITSRAIENSTRTFSRATKYARFCNNNM